MRTPGESQDEYSSSVHIILNSIKHFTSAHQMFSSDVHRRKRFCVHLCTVNSKEAQVVSRLVRIAQLLVLQLNQETN